MDGNVDVMSDIAQQLLETGLMIAMKLGTDIRVLQRMNPIDFGDSPTFPLAPT